VRFIQNKFENRLRMPRIYNTLEMTWKFIIFKTMIIIRTLLSSTFSYLVGCSCIRKVHIQIVYSHCGQVSNLILSKQNQSSFKIFSINFIWKLPEDVHNLKHTRDGLEINSFLKCDHYSHNIHIYDDVNCNCIGKVP